MIYTVILAPKAKKAITKIPRHVATKLLSWVTDVENRGLEEVRKIPSYHDERLKGARKGQNSIRLSRAYRAIYEIKHGNIEFVEIREVNKHEY